MDLLKTDEDAEKDRFGLPKMSTNTEIAISFTLTILGFLLILVTAFTITEEVDLSPIYLGLLLVLSGYFFLLESVRELEQKDHFLSKKLMNRDEEEQEE